MIRITVDEDAIVVTLVAAHPIRGAEYMLRWDVRTSWAAKLLTHNLREHMGAMLKAIRVDAYNQGWRDAKARARKRPTDYFANTWDFRFKP